MTASLRMRQADARRASSRADEPVRPRGDAGAAGCGAADIPEYDDRLKLTLEKQKVGMYLSGHPLQKYAAELQGEAWTVEKILARAENPETVKDMEGATVEIAGIFSQLKARTTRRSRQMMANATFEDLTGSIGMLIFPAAYEQYKDTIQMDAIAGSVRVMAIGEETELLLEAVRPYTGPQVKPIGASRAQTPSKPQAHSAARVPGIAPKPPGGGHCADSRDQGGAFGLLCGLGASVKVWIQKTDRRYTLKPVKYSEELHRKLEEILGAENLEVIS